MKFFYILCKSTVFLSLLLGAVAVLGDFLLKILQSDISKALCDNLTHGIIGGLSWLIIAVNYDLKYGMLDALLCAILSSGIDADHFVAARSLFIKDAVRLSSRPFLHSTTLTLTSCVVMLLLINTLQLSATLHTTLQRIVWLCIVAFLSHHIRDGNRRGLWLWPLPFWSNNTHYSTPLLPKALYVGLIIALPHIISLLIFPDNSDVFSRKKGFVHIV